jgi:hypothetical protein
MQRNSARRKTPAIFSALLLSLLSFGLPAQGAQKKVPAGSVITPDKGKLDILLDGKSVGREEFEIVSSSGGWTAKGTTKINPPQGAASTVSGTLTLQPDGTPTSYEWSSQGEKNNGSHILFANGVAKITLQMQGAHSYQQDISFTSPLIAVLDNNLYYQYAVLARLYDWSRRSSQTFPVLIPQELLPGTVSVDWAGAVNADGKAYEGLKVTTSDLEIMLYLDSTHRLMRLEVPSAKVVVVRE